jgi:hypothetical protein
LALSIAGSSAVNFWYLFPAAFLVGVLFNLNPSCGSGALVWASTQTRPVRMALLALIRIAVLALVGALAGHFGTALRAPWGVLLLAAALYLLYTTIGQARAGRRCVGALLRTGAALPWLLALVPPPSGYIGLAIFYGGFNPPSAAQGALTLSIVGLGLTLPVWIAIVKPTWWAAWKQRLAGAPTLYRWQLAYQFVGAALLTLVGLAFVFVQGFHRPLLELVR